MKHLIILFHFRYLNEPYIFPKTKLEQVKYEQTYLKFISFEPSLGIYTHASTNESLIFHILQC